MQNGKDKVMGGEFALQLPPKEGPELNTVDDMVWFASGRAALFHIVRSILQERPFARFFLPDYLCVSVIDAVEIAGGRIEFYAVDEKLQCDIADLAGKCKDADVVLLINYFGGVDYREAIRRIRTLSKDLWVIVDEVQAFFDMYRGDHTGADFVFTSFRKSLPLPDGGWGVSYRTLLQPSCGDNSFVGYKIAGGLLKQEPYRRWCGDEVCLSLLEQGEVLLDKAYEADCSDFTRRSFGNLELETMATMRQRNAAFVVEALADMGLVPVLSFASESVPLFVPIRLPQRDKVRRKLFDERIFCPVHWPVEKYGKRLRRGQEMAACELSLIVDSRYDLRDMERMMATIGRAL